MNAELESIRSDFENAVIRLSNFKNKLGLFMMHDITSIVEVVTEVLETADKNYENENVYIKI